MNILVDFCEYVRLYLAPHMRKKNRIHWLSSLLDIQSIFNDFSAWRNEYRYRMMLTSQQYALQSHLQKLFGAGIKVTSSVDGYQAIGLNSEPAHWLSFGTPTFPLNGEKQLLFEGYDFAVIIPSALDADVVRAEVEKYKLADKTIKVIKTK